MPKATMIAARVFAVRICRFSQPKPRPQRRRDALGGVRVGDGAPDHRGLFRLMFRNGLVNRDDSRYWIAGRF